MKSSTRLLCLGALVFVFGCDNLSEQLAIRDRRPEGLSAVTNTVTIDGATEAVFDLVTTARFWPQWHPATRVVGGVTERPYRLADRIYEAGRIGTQEFQTSWKVVQHVRPSRVVLQSEKSPTRITYSFQARNGATVFTRELEYQMENFAAVAAAPGAVEQLMRSQSEQAVRQLKSLVETILGAEGTGIQ
jgi:uncharacterized protein YndB with AHSA1/START domain